MLTEPEKSELADLTLKWNATDILPEQRVRLAELEKKRDIQPVLLFSGGRTSGYMLRHMLDTIPDYREKYLTIFCNTGREMPQTLDFVHEVEERWEVPVIWLEYDRKPAVEITPGIYPTPRRNKNLAGAAARGETAHWFRHVDYYTASRDGRPFDTLLNWMNVLPNVVSRGCSMQLKIRTAMRYIFAQGHTEYYSLIGIRKDESHRSIQILANCDTFEHPKFPLIEEGKTEKDVLHFWAKNDFDLQLRSYEGNCDLCFLKSKFKRVVMARRNPQALEWWLNWETRKSNVGQGAQFRKGEPYSLIAELAGTPNDLLPARLRLQVDATEADKRVRETDPEDFDIPCSCAEKGFGGIGEEHENLMDDPMF